MNATEPDYDFSKMMESFNNRKRYNGFTLSDLEKIPNDNIEQAIIDYIHDYVIQDDYENEYEKVKALSNGMQYVYTTWWLEAEVNNGGFNQYFYNSSGQFAEEAYN